MKNTYLYSHPGCIDNTIRLGLGSFIFQYENYIYLITTIHSCNELKLINAMLLNNVTLLCINMFRFNTDEI